MISRLRTWVGAGALWLTLAGSVLAGAQIVVKVEGTGIELGETPLVVALAKPIEVRSRCLLQPRDGGQPLPANVFQDRGQVYLGTVLDRLPASGARTFDLVADPLGLPGGVVDLIGEKDRLRVQLGDQPVTTYVTNDGPKPYYFPLLGPSGGEMTRSFPMKRVPGETTDHPHHRSFWFTHGSVNKVDFWSELPNHGTIRETSRPTVVGGSGIGVVRTTDDWLGPDGKKVLEDERVLRIYNTRKARVLDFDVTLKATEGPVTFGDTKEGMFGLRVASSMDVTAKKGGRIVNAEGITDKAAWGLASPWVDYTGPVAGKTVGLAILNHPESFRYPTTWHVRDYGLFAANPFGWHDFGRKETGEYVLPVGQSITFRYRVILHEGETSSAAVSTAFEGYRNPPQVVVETSTR